MFRVIYIYPWFRVGAGFFLDVRMAQTSRVVQFGTAKQQCHSVCAGRRSSAGHVVEEKV